nr:ABC transporter permease [Maliibacterium massiliense]
MVQPTNAPAGKAGSFSRIMRKYSILLVLILLIIIASFIAPNFLTGDNMANILRQTSVYIMMACGMTMLIISGSTDLSAGAMATLGGCMGVHIATISGSIPLGIVVAIATGAVVGFINGFLVTKFTLAPFIVTLAMQTALKGAVLLYCGGQPIYNLGPIKYLGQGSIGPLPTPAFIMILFVAGTWIVLNRIKYGRYLYAVGGNEEVAIASGINSKRIKLVAFVINSMIAGFAGIVLMARLNSGQPTSGLDYHFEAIIGSVLGGTSLSGGVGNIFGAAVGCWIVGIINNTLNLLNVQSYIHQIIKGALIAAAVILDSRKISNRKK